MKANFVIRVFTLTPLLFAASVLHAEVTSVNATGFALAFERSVQVEPDAIYAAMTRIGEWWDPAHSWEGQAENLYLDMRIGGCFCEKLANGGGVEHLHLAYFAPGKEIRLTGGLGPLQGMGMGGAMVWTITPGEAGNTVRWSYTVHGHGTEESMGKLAPIVDYVQQQAFYRLLRYIETGSPEKTGAE
jgi:hypothetical protein